MLYRFVEVAMSDLSILTINPSAGALSPPVAAGRVTTPQTKSASILSRSVSISLTEKAFVTVANEAKARGISPERLMLVAVLDYLGRSGIAKGSKTAPMVFHIPPHIRKKILKGAQATGITPNQWIIAAARKAVA